MRGGRGEDGELVYTIMAILSSVFLAAALVLVMAELKTFYSVFLFKFVGN